MNPYLRAIAKYPKVKQQALERRQKRREKSNPKQKN